ncbi:MAG: signal peptidase II [Chloroflexi bacterium]|nr:MAG: signal peptidase II [Chloroflexota bacterium]
MSQTKHRWIFLGVVVGIVLAIDQITKRVIVANLRNGETHDLIPALSPLFQVTRSHNRGASFGLLPEAGDLFLVIAIVVTGFMLYYYPRIEADGRTQRLASGLIIGGALGNAIDRINYGFVVDFIHYQIPNVISNVSNIADHAIVLGVILIFIDSWRAEAAEKNKPDEADEHPQHEDDVYPEEGEHLPY